MKEKYKVMVLEKKDPVRFARDLERYLNRGYHKEQIKIGYFEDVCGAVSAPCAFRKPLYQAILIKIEMVEEED